jgi:hypothetical protein
VREEAVQLRTLPGIQMLPGSPGDIDHRRDTCIAGVSPIMAASGIAVMRQRGRIEVVPHLRRKGHTTNFLPSTIKQGFWG